MGDGKIIFEWRIHDDSWRGVNANIDRLLNLREGYRLYDYVEYMDTYNIGIKYIRLDNLKKGYR